MARQPSNAMTMTKQETIAVARGAVSPLLSGSPVLAPGVPVVGEPDPLGLGASVIHRDVGFAASTGEAQHDHALPQRAAFRLPVPITNQLPIYAPPARFADEETDRV